jgi:hypothetical protein
VDGNNRRSFNDIGKAFLALSKYPESVIFKAMNFKIGENSWWEFVLAYFWTFLLFALFAGTIVLAIATLVGNIRDKWPYYDKARKRKVIKNLVVFFGLIGLFIFLGSAM